MSVAKKRSAILSAPNAEPVQVGRSLWGSGEALARTVRRSYERVESNLIAVSLCGAIGMPLYYFVWHDLFPQPYENLWLRLAGAVLCLLLAIKDFWPRVVRPALPSLWYVTVLFALPFFFTFMMLKNGTSVWFVSSIAELLLLILLVDWINVLILTVLGTAAGWATYLATSPALDDLDPYFEHLPVFLFALIAGSVFNYRREMLKRERLDAMLSVGGNIAREMRRPLLGIRTSAAGLRHYLPDLIKSYETAEAHGLSIPTILPEHRDALRHALDRAEAETAHAEVILEMLLANTGRIEADRGEFARHSMVSCVERALDRYPFTSEKERRLVRWNADVDFRFFGSDTVMVHILFNLIKTALASVARAGKGEITISLECGASANRLRVRDGGAGVAPYRVPHVFDIFSPLESRSGTGPGLAFVKQSAELFGGTISCHSEVGEYTEFELSLPAP